MAIPFPPGATSGAQSPGQIARQLLGDFVWIARWSDEIGSDADLDLKKLAQLAFLHCRRWHLATTNNDILRAFEFWARVDQGIEWPDRATMISELSGLKTQAGVVFIEVRDNVPEARSFAQRTYDQDGNEIEVPAVVPKANHANAVTETATLRALFV